MAPGSASPYQATREYRLQRTQAISSVVAALLSAATLLVTVEGRLQQGAQTAVTVVVPVEMHLAERIVLGAANAAYWILGDDQTAWVACGVAATEPGFSTITESACIVEPGSRADQTLLDVLGDR